MPEVVPKVGTFRFVESKEMGGLRCGGSDELGEFARGALTNLGNAFYTHAEVPEISRESSLKRGGRRFGRIFFGFKQELHEPWADKINRRSPNGRALNEVTESKSVFVGAKGNDEAAAGGCGRKRPEAQASDDRKSSERADEKFVKVVAGNVFNDASATLAETARTIHKFGANEEVAGGTVRMAKRRVDAGGDDAADGGFKIKRNREREKLFLLVKGSGKVVETGASIHAEGEITGIIMGDLAETRHVDSDVVAGRRHADFEFGAMSTGDEGELLESGETRDFGGLFGGRWFGDGGRNYFVDDVLRADCGIGSDE